MPNFELLITPPTPATRPTGRSVFRVSAGVATSAVRVTTPLTTDNPMRLIDRWLSFEVPLATSCRSSLSVFVPSPLRGSDHGLLRGSVGSRQISRPPVAAPPRECVVPWCDGRELSPSDHC